MTERQDNAAQREEPRCFVYQKSSPNFKEILKFVLTSQEETRKLRQKIKGIACYEAVPNMRAPISLKFHALSQAVSGIRNVF